MITPSYSSSVTMSDDWNSLIVKEDDETFTVNIDEWSCSCKEEECDHIRLAQQYHKSWWAQYEHNSEMAAMLYDEGEE